MFKINTDQGIYFFDNTRNQLVEEKDAKFLCPNKARFEDQTVKIQKFNYHNNTNFLHPNNIETLDVVVNGNEIEKIFGFVKTIGKLNLKNLRKIRLFGNNSWDTLTTLIPKLRGLYPSIEIRLFEDGKEFNDELSDFCMSYKILVELNGDIKPICFKHQNVRAIVHVEPNLDKLVNDYRTKYLKNVPISIQFPYCKISKFTNEDIETLRQTTVDCGMFHLKTNIHDMVERYRKSFKDPTSPYETAGDCQSSVGKQVAVDLNCSVYRCHEDKEPIGNIETFFDGSHAIKHLYPWWERPHCLNCIHVSFCGGGCPKLSPNEHKIFCNARKAYLDGILRLVFWLHYGSKVISIEEVQSV